MLVLGIVLAAAGIIVKMLFRLPIYFSMFKEAEEGASRSDIWDRNRPALKIRWRDLIWFAFIVTGLTLIAVSLEK